MNKNFKTIRLDLFKLHDSQDNTKNWILAKGKNLKDILKDLIEKTIFSHTELVKYLMNKHNLSIATAERLVYLKREWYPLIFIKELVDLTNSPKYEIQDQIEILKSVKPPVVEYVAIKELTINLCKIAGAHAADGTMHDSYIAITDGHKSNIIALINWFKEFQYNPKLIRISDRQYGIKFSSRVISRYLLKYFNFPSGCKQYTVKEPEIIKNAPMELRKAFALGALTFESGVGINKQVALCVSSKAFRDSIVEILDAFGFNYNSMEKQSGNYWRFWTNTINKEEASKWMELFEKNTEKWFKLKDIIDGYSRQVSSFEEAVQILNSIYPRQSSSKIILNEVLSAFKELRRTHRYKLAKYLIQKNNLESYGGKWAHSLKYYLDILKSANIISMEKKRFGPKASFGTIVREEYIFNQNISSWRLPDRKSLLN
tara:strand:+ start:65 stop:1351 length:1287 start_codon:yes stop_codon:yes gene_type:complete